MEKDRQSELRAKIVDKANEDEDFRARLLSDPKTTIEQEFDVTLPASMSIEVHEQSATTTHLVLPFSGLSERDLQAAAGGITPSKQGYLDWKEIDTRRDRDV